MFVDPRNSQDGWDCARDALAEIGSYPVELQTFLADLFDRLNQWKEDLLLHELDQQQAKLIMQRSGLQEQIDQLTAMVTKLTDTGANGNQHQGNGRQIVEIA